MRPSGRPDWITDRSQAFTIEYSAQRQWCADGLSGGAFPGQGFVQALVCLDGHPQRQGRSLHVGGRDDQTFGPMVAATTCAAVTGARTADSRRSSLRATASITA